MSITIHLHDDLARRLQAEAQLRSISMDELANQLLGGAIAPVATEEDWGHCNQRRLELIRRSTRAELTPREQEELDQLQSRLDEQFETFDAGLLQQLEEMKQAITRASA